jgi:AbiU2
VVKDWRKLTQEEQSVPVGELADRGAEVAAVVEANIRRALVLHEINQPAAYDLDIIRRFDRSYAGNVFVTIRDEITRSTVLALARAWDTTRDAQSIPHLARLLDRAELVEELVVRRRAGMLALKGSATFTVNRPEDIEILKESAAQYAEELADRAERHVRETIPIVLERVSAFMSSPLKESLLVLRHKVLAHSLAITDAERKAKTPIEPLKIGDEEAIAVATLPIANNLNLLFRGHNDDLVAISDIWKSHAAEFWGRFGNDR